MPFLNYNNDGVISKIEWTPLSKEVQPQAPLNEMYKIPITLGEQTEANIREWYATYGGSISPEEIEICRNIDIETAEENKREMNTPVVLKYEYGTPEFWKDWWAKKRAKEAKEGTESTAKKLTKVSKLSSESKKQKPSVPKSAKQTSQA